MQIRDRIKELRRVPAAQLRPNPRNWRRHPPHQQEVLRGLLAEIGYADALLARELPDGTLELVDGHLRAETTPDCQVPVLVLDITDQEAATLLAALDPLAALAQRDEQMLARLVHDLDTENAALQQMLSELLVADVGKAHEWSSSEARAQVANSELGTDRTYAKHGAALPSAGQHGPAGASMPASPTDATTAARAPTSHANFSAWQVVIDCSSEAEQRATYERLTAEGYSCRVLVL